MSLFLISTPIGNLEDMSPRAISTLKSVDLVLAEDTRHTGLLLKHFQIKTPMKSYYDEVERQKTPYFISLLQQGKNLALVSDAGTPLIADPGFKLVQQAISENIPIDVIPGPSALITALLISGLPPDKFVFLNYPPQKGSKRTQWFEKFHSLFNIGGLTLIWYESPYRILKTLNDLSSILPANQIIIIARELTKLHQEIERDTLEHLKTKFSSLPKGELTLLTHP